MLDYGIIQKAKEKLENITGLVNVRREELKMRTLAQADDWNNVEQNKKIRALQDFIGEYETISRDINDFLELTGVCAESELANEFHRVKDEFDAFYIKTLLVGKYDGCDCVLNVTAGSGGTEAQDWAEMVMRMEVRFAEQQGFNYEITD
ncbi:MAG: PCRF domain-containing protein, partial [Christensenellaceae bacterium]|nr:PCRF domain-containing protein [Christensenellaceae bacterium]